MELICAPCTYSPASEEDCLPTSFSDTVQLSLLSWMPTPAESSANAQQTDGSQDCMCGKEMSDCSIHPSTPAAWIASMQASLARTLALLESRQAYLREPDQVFTKKSCVLLTSLNLDTCFWRTLQQSFLTDSEPFSQTWPRWGMTAGGFAYEHPMSGLRITGTDGFCWPTPHANCSPGAGAHGDGGLNLQTAVTMWPTPCQRDYKGIGRSRLERTGSKAGECLPQSVGGMLSPAWTGWLMGFPIGWASLKDTETPKSHYKPQQHGDFSEASK